MIACIVDSHTKGPASAAKVRSAALKDEEHRYGDDSNRTLISANTCHGIRHQFYGQLQKYTGLPSVSLLWAAIVFDFQARTA